MDSGQKADMKPDGSGKPEPERWDNGADQRPSVAAANSPVTPVGLAAAAARRSVLHAEEKQDERLFRALASVKDVMGKMCEHLSRTHPL